VNGPALAHAARTADIIGLTMLGSTLPDGNARAVRWAPGRLDATVSFIAKSAGERAGALELNALVQAVVVTDHCGANPALAGRRIVVQATELEAARAENYTFPELVDFDGATFDRIDGEAEIADGLVALPTPGHSPGHQSLVVCAHDGTLFVAGQAMDFSTTTPGPVGGCASAYASAHLARRATHELGRPLAPWPDWLDRIEQLDPARVVFAHDGAIFEPDIPSHARS